MTDVGQFLADLEAKAKAAEKNWEKKYSEESDEAIRQLEASMNFIDSASPAAVLRLVGMVRWLSPVLHKFCEELCTPYKIGNGTCTECPLLRDGKCIVSAEAMLSTAYAETEDRHD